VWQSASKPKTSPKPDATVGSPAYYSPEQIRKLPITPQTDIYALGMVTYEALMNEHPYGNYMRSMQVIMKHLHEDLPALALPKAKQAGYLTGVLRQATHKEPEQRQNNIIDFLQDFSEAIGVT
jgi:serine/threonine protein kinase